MSESKNDARPRHIIQLVGLILITIPAFFGLLYFFEGNIAFAAIGALVLFLALYLIESELLIPFKEAKNDYKQNKMLEIVSLLLFYGLFSFIGLVLFLHFWNIEVNEKTKIQQELTDYVEYPSQQYERYFIEGNNTTYVNNELATLESKLKADFKWPTYINSTLNSVETKLLENNIFGDTKTELDQYSLATLSNIKGWNRFFISKSLADMKDMDKYYETTLVDINKQAMTSPHLSASAKFDYPANPNSLPILDNLLDSLKNGAGLVSIAIYLFLVFITLLPYILTDRHGLHGGGGTISNHEGATTY